jgi:acyl carrier protein
MIDYRIRVTACCALAFWLFSAATGCDIGPRPLSGPVAVVRSHDRGLSADEAAIIVILGKQFGKEPEKIQSSTSLKDLGADELDLVEVVMELEEEFQVSIPDGAVQKAAGEATMDNMLKSLTPPKLVALVEEARRTPSKVATGQTEAASGDGKSNRPQSTP